MKLFDHHTASPKPKASLALSWDEIKYLHESKLALRSVTDEDKAVREKIDGGIGDAIPLASYGLAPNLNLDLWNHPRYAEMEIKDNFWPAYRLIENNQITDSDKNKLIHNLLDGIRNHVTIATNCFNSRAFLFIDRGNEALQPYDFSSYPLGKCGTAKFTQSDVKKFIGVMAPFKWDKDIAYNNIIIAIKDLYFQNNLQKAKKYYIDNICDVYANEIKHRYFKPNASRFRTIANLKEKINSAHQLKEVNKAFQDALEEIQTPTCTSKFFSFFKSSYGSHRNSSLYKIIQNSLNSIDPDSVSTSNDLGLNKKNYQLYL